MAFPSDMLSLADGVVAVAGLVVAGAYLFGTARVWAADAAYWPLRTRRGRLPVWRVALFLAGLTCVALSLSGAAFALAERMLALHALQHHLLGTLGAPLLVLGEPTLAFGGLLTPWRRAGLAQAAGRLATRRLFRWTLGRALVVWSAHVAVLWAGYIPGAYGLLHEQRPLHTLHHLALLATGLAFWWLLIGPATTWLPRARGRRTIATLAAWLQNNALSAMVAFSPLSAFPEYLARVPLWNLSAQEAHYLAGAVQYLPAEIVYLFALSVLAFGLLTDADRRAASRADARHAAALSLSGAAQSGLLTRREQMLREEWRE